MANEPLIPNVPFLPREPKDADDLLRWAKEVQEAIRENYRVTQKRLEELNLTGSPGGRETAIGARRFYWNDETDQLEHDPDGFWHTVGDSRPAIAQGRLTLQTGEAVPTSDQTAKGTIFYTPYTGDKIALLDPSGINMLTADSADITQECSGPGWTSYNGGVATVTSSNPQHGRSCLQVTTPGGGVGQGCYLPRQFAVTAGQRYTLSAYVRGAGDLQLYFYWYDINGAGIGSSAGVLVAPGTRWARFADANQLAPAGAVSAALFCVTNWGYAPQAVTFYLDSVQVELFASARPWTPGRTWKTIRFNGTASGVTETSVSLSGTLATYCYDVFGYIDANGDLALSLWGWLNATARARAIVRSGGAWVIDWDYTRRYLGTFYCYSNGLTSDALVTRYLWNVNNRVLRNLFRYEGTDHTYNSSAWRYWNNSSTNNLQFVEGLPEDATNWHLNASMNGRVTPTMARLAFGIALGNVFGSLAVPNTSPAGVDLGCGEVVAPVLGLATYYVQEAVTGGTADYDWYRFSVAVMA